MSDGAFLLSVSGQIEYIEALSEAGSCWYCKYEMVSGPDWKLISGLDSGLSQNVQVIKNGENITLNFPIETIFKSTNVYGWPQIVLSVYRNATLEGYGRMHVPISVGLHSEKVSMAKPISSTFFGQLASYWGYQPELLQPKILATTAGNSAIRMVTTGNIQVTFNIMSQGFSHLGYDAGQAK